MGSIRDPSSCIYAPVDGPKTVRTRVRCPRCQRADADKRKEDKRKRKEEKNRLAEEVKHSQHA